MTSAQLREAGEADFPAIQAIYAHHVTHGFGSFEEMPPDVAEMALRWQRVTGAGLPYVVCEVEGRVVGFAYASPYRPRLAYRFSVENSVYVAPDSMRRGHGHLMLSMLIERCAALGYRRMVAMIGDRNNQRSIGLHRRLGFEKAGHLPAMGFKHGQWVDIMIMQRPLGDGDATMPADEPGGPDSTALA